MASTPIAVLPLALRPKKIDTLVRLGSDYDGGYLVDGRSISSSDLLVGLGINDDWTFEKSFKEQKDVPLFAFDASIGEKVFFKALIKAVPRIDRPSLILRRLRTILDYRSFFKGTNKHFEKFVGMDKAPSFVSLATIFNTIIPSTAKNVFLKIDIEGWEYRLLDEIIGLADRISGLVIEFHDVDLHLEKIENFVKNLPLNLCHVHCNNCAPTNGSDIPLVIEVTFTKFDVDQAYADKLPNRIDMPNSKNSADYAISFA